MDVLFETYRGRENDPRGQTNLKIEDGEGLYYLWVWQPKMGGSLMVGFTPEEFVEFLQAITPEPEWAAVWADGLKAGQESAYIGHYDQFDRGSLMFKETVNPHVPTEEG